MLKSNFIITVPIRVPVSFWSFAFILLFKFALRSSSGDPSIKDQLCNKVMRQEIDHVLINNHCDTRLPQNLNVNVITLKHNIYWSCLKALKIIHCNILKCTVIHFLTRNTDLIDSKAFGNVFYTEYEQQSICNKNISLTPQVTEHTYFILWPFQSHLRSFKNGCSTRARVYSESSSQVWES